MKCDYEFTVEWYTTLSKACYNCPQNTTDCNRKHCITADGVERVVMSVNRMIPGPLIQVCQNDIINVVVHNNLRMGESTSIHWHGQLQNGSPYMDGVAMITQCPIHPHTSFQYQFIAKDVGTHFWHAHSGLQRGDGVFGGIVVKQPKENDVHFNEYDYDLNEHVIIVHDWFKETIISKFAFHHHDTTNNDKPNSILINGKGVKVNNNDSDDTYKTPRSLFQVRQGNRYRFRLIHSGVTFCPIQFTVQNHSLRVISSDGKPFDPIDVNAVVLNAGKTQ